MAASVQIRPLQDREAIAALLARRVGRRFSFDWRDLDPEEHALAFVVAKAMDAEILDDIASGIRRALLEGTTLEQFRAELEPLLRQKGWWGRQRMVDPATGEEKVVQLGSAWRLRTIFETNLRVSNAAGRWERYVAQKDAYPYLMYQAVLDEATRESHAAWSGIILPVDHPFWLTHYPPNDWGCRCWPIQISDDMLRRRGLRVSTEEEVKAAMGEPGVWTNPRTGTEQPRWPGIGPGWAYNAGIARREQLEAAAREMAQGRRTGPEAFAQAAASSRNVVEPGFAKSKAWTEALTELARDAAATAWVLRRQARTGIEHLVAFDESGRLLQAGRGVGSHAVIAHWRAKADSARRVRVHHSHPEPGGLSPQDLRSTGGLRAAVTVVAHDPTGSSYAARVLADALVTAAHLASLTRLARDRLRRSGGAAWLSEHAAALALARGGWIRYEAALSPTAEAQVEALGPAWPALIDWLAEEVGSAP